VSADKPPKQVKVVSKCRVCKKLDEFELPAEGLKRRRKGVPLAEAFPSLAAERIQQLVTMVCPGCQEKEAK
jgi:hypothetical protein